MPLLRVALTPGAFDDGQKQWLATALTEAACRAESVPDEPQSRMRALVLFEELSPGSFYSAAQRAEAAVAGVFIDVPDPLLCHRRPALRRRRRGRRR